MSKKCPNCNAEMEKQDYKHPYITRYSKKVFMNINVDVYRCPWCEEEVEDLPDDEDGYSAGAGLFSDD